MNPRQLTDQGLVIALYWAEKRRDDATCRKITQEQSQRKSSGKWQEGE